MSAQNSITNRPSRTDKGVYTLGSYNSARSPNPSSQGIMMPDRAAAAISRPRLWQIGVGVDVARCTGQSATGGWPAAPAAIRRRQRQRRTLSIRAEVLKRGARQQLALPARCLLHRCTYRVLRPLNDRITHHARYRGLLGSMVTPWRPASLAPACPGLRDRSAPSSSPLPLLLPLLALVACSQTGTLVRAVRSTPLPPLRAPGASLRPRRWSRPFHARVRTKSGLSRP
jgi:hypothetical protein